jgi:energy-coupling factor transport system ATP-binding protein
MIEFRHFSFTYTGAERPALSDITLTIRSGECVLLQGPSGCGKSTLLMTLNGIVPSVLRGEAAGEILIDSMAVTGRRTTELATTVGMVFQNPDNQLFAITVEEDVAFGPENLAMEKDAIRSRVDEALACTGMTSCRNRQVHRLSGGQKQRTAIAGLCAMQPAILVFDEPTADLDPDGTREVISMIGRLNREEKKTVIIVEHKIREILPVVDRVITLDNGRITGDLPGARFPTPPALPPRRKLPAPGPGGDAALLDIRNLTCSYPDGTTALREISLSIRAGECVAFIGRNGSGKTTLTKCIKGLLPPSAGTITLYDAKSGRSVADRGSRIGYLFQNPDHQIITDRVDTEIAIGLSGLPAATAEQITRDALAQVGLLSLSQRDPCTLSRGERQRLAVAAVAALDPEILIFDEPTTGQDPENLAAILETLDHMRQQGKTVLIVTHDHELALSCADRVVRIDEGRIREIIVPERGLGGSG